MKDQPTKPKYMPQQAPEELEGLLPADWTPIGPETKGFAGKLGKFGARAEYEPPKPKEASECRIFVNLIDEGRFVQAKKFWQKQYSLQRGDLVELTNHGCAGLKGCIRLIEANSPQVVIDLFKNDVITEQAVRVALYQVQPYL
jgi:hypothetical protein